MNVSQWKAVNVRQVLVGPFIVLVGLFLVLVGLFIVLNVSL